MERRCRWRYYEMEWSLRWRDGLNYEMVHWEIEYEDGDNEYYEFSFYYETEYYCD